MHPWPNIRKQRAARPPSNGGSEWFGRRGSSCRSGRRLGSQDAIGSSDGYGGGRGKVPARFLSNVFPAALGSFPGWFIVRTARFAATGGCTAASFPFVNGQLSGYVRWKSHLSPAHARAGGGQVAAQSDQGGQDAAGCPGLGAVGGQEGRPFGHPGGRRPSAPGGRRHAAVGEIVFRKHRPSLAKLEAVWSNLILPTEGLPPANCQARSEDALGDCYDMALGSVSCSTLLPRGNGARRGGEFMRALCNVYGYFPFVGSWTRSCGKYLPKYPRSRVSKASACAMAWPPTRKSAIRCCLHLICCPHPGHFV